MFKTKKNVIKGISLWHLYQSMDSYIAVIDYEKLDSLFKGAAEEFARTDQKTTSDYVYFSIVYVQGEKAVFEQTKNGLNIMMIPKEDYALIRNNENAVSRRVRFIGYLQKKSIKYIEKYLKRIDTFVSSLNT